MTAETATAAEKERQRFAFQALPVVHRRRGL